MKWFIKLHAGQLEHARLLAKARNDKPAKHDKKFHENLTGEEIHYMALLAELAWSELSGWPVDEKIRLGGDDGIDFKANGRTYQVKARELKETDEILPDLLCRMEYAKADRYILADVDPTHGTVYFVGWCTRDELIQTKIDIHNQGQRYIRERSKLRKFPNRIN